MGLAIAKFSTIIGAGSGSTVPAAPNVTSATGAADYSMYGHDARFGFTGTIALPTGDADYSHLQTISVLAFSPGSDSGVEIARLVATWAGSTVDYAGGVFPQPSAGETWTLKFIASNEAGDVTASPVSQSVAVAAAAVSSVTASEDTSMRRQDELQGLHTGVSVVPVIASSQYPRVITLWLDYDDGNGWQWRGWWTITAGGQIVSIDVWSPTDPASSSWQVAAEAGAIDGTIAPSGAAVTGAFTVAAPSACPSTDVTGAQFIANSLASLMDYSVDSVGVIRWVPHQVQWSQPSLADDPWYWFSFITVQKGHVSSGTWVPATDYEGQDEHTTLYAGRQIVDTGAIQGGASVPGSTVTFPLDINLGWTFPPVNLPNGTANPDRTFRFRIYACSKLGQNPDNATGTFTLQSCWSGGADHYDLTPAAQPAALDLYQASAGSAGAIGTTHLAALAVTTAKIADAAVLTGKLADLAVEAAKLANSSVTATKIANLAVGTAAIANLAVTDAKIDTLAANKITAGTISASISMTAPTLVITSGTVTINIDATNFIKLADSSVSRKIQFGSGVNIRVGDTSDTAYSQVNATSIVIHDNGQDRTDIRAENIIMRSAGGTTDAQYTSSGVTINGNSVLAARQTDPGTASGWADATAQSWANSLRSALRNHGLI